MNKKKYIFGFAITSVMAVAAFATVQTAYESWNSNGLNTVGSRAVAVGSGNNVYYDSLTGGVDNDATRTSLAFGTNNSSSDSSAAFGAGNYVDDQGLVAGNGNTVTNGGGAIGHYNTIYSRNSFAVGTWNEALTMATDLEILC